MPLFTLITPWEQRISGRCALCQHLLVDGKVQYGEKNPRLLSNDFSPGRDVNVE